MFLQPARQQEQTFMIQVHEVDTGIQFSRKVRFELSGAIKLHELYQIVVEVAR